jgi:hypothetical protein
MKSIDNVGVTFINTVLGRGVMNGVINLTLGVLQFTPDDKGEAIDPDIGVAARLRMDVVCARQLHEALGDLLVLIDKSDAEQKQGLNGTSAQPAVSTEKSN